MEMKACKECGKLFVPKSKNSVYCDALHYRPCPVCGKPVEAKYLSDPPRCCSNECKAVARKKTKETAKTTLQVSGVRQFTAENSDNYSSDDTTLVDRLEIPYSGVATFIGKPVLGLIPGHVYHLNIDKGEYTYELHIKHDVTDDEDMSVFYPLASQISIHQRFSFS